MKAVKLLSVFHKSLDEVFFMPLVSRFPLKSETQALEIQGQYSNKKKKK